MNWTHNFNRVCQLLDPSLGRNISEINIYFMGGSMTFGQDTNGCCCDENLDKKCPKTSCPEHFKEENGDTHRSYCSWVRYFGRWIESEFPNVKINIISLAGRGEGSRITSEFILNRYPPKTEKSFKSTDIVFLDFSVNDCSESYAEKIGLVSESLIRRFLIYGDDTPILILLETFPVRIVGQYATPDPPGSGSLHDYTTFYRNVARYYNIPLWSYATSMFTNYTSSLPAFQLIRFTGSYPGWFVHLNVAVLIIYDY